MGRKPIHKQAMTPAQRQQRRRRLLKHEQKVAEGAGKRSKRDARETAMAQNIRAAASSLTETPPRYGVIYADPPGGSSRGPAKPASTVPPTTTIPG
jgi:hypothetical protein